MIAHVVLRQICHRDWMWIVKDFYDTTVDTGHEKTYGKARKSGRAAKKDYIRRVKAHETAGLLKPHRV